MICLDLLEQTHMPRDLEKFYLRKKVVGFWALLYTYVEIDVFPSKKCPKQICTRLKRLHIICQERVLFDKNRIFLGIGFDEKRFLKSGSDWLNNSVWIFKVSSIRTSKRAEDFINLWTVSIHPVRIPLFTLWHNLNNFCSKWKFSESFGNMESSTTCTLEKLFVDCDVIIQEM